MQTETREATCKGAVLPTDEPEVGEAADSDTGGGRLVKTPFRNCCSESLVDKLDLEHFQKATADAVEAATQTLPNTITTWTLKVYDYEAIIAF